MEEASRVLRNYLSRGRRGVEAHAGKGVWTDHRRMIMPENYNSAMGLEVQPITDGPSALLEGRRSPSDGGASPKKRSGKLDARPPCLLSAIGMI